MPNPYFQFNQFRIQHDRCAMKVTTDGCLFGAWVAHAVSGKPLEAALDIGTGTGLLALMAAQKNDCPIDAIEIDRDAAGQAAENIAASPWADRIRVTKGDLLQHTFTRQYPLIFSNPPFYETELASANTGRNLAHHSGGLLLKDLFAKTFELLTTEGKAYFLLPAKREQEIFGLIQDAGLHLEQIIRVHQTSTHEAFRLMLEVSKTPIQKVQEKKLLICSEGRSYSPEFTDLLKDYYLYL